MLTGHPRTPGAIGRGGQDAARGRDATETAAPRATRAGVDKDAAKRAMINIPAWRLIVVTAEKTIDAPADTVFGYIRDMREHHPKFLPPEFSDFQVESGGVGPGTITQSR